MDALKKGFTLAFLLALVALLVVFFYHFPLPPLSSLKPDILMDTPVQYDVAYPPFVKKVGHYTYQLTPRYVYQVSGLILSRHDTSSWLDISHQEDPIGTLDVCLAWGKNLSDGIYTSLQLEHGDFSCAPKSGQSLIGFTREQLSNNHLIPSNDYLVEKIAALDVGDQIEIKGWLVDYQILDENNRPQAVRTTSFDRQDQVAEIIWVNDLQVYKTHYPLLRQLRSYLPVATGVVGALLMIFTLFL